MQKREATLSHLVRNPLHTPAAHSQQGVVLLVALIVMAVIAITSAAAIKSASNQDLISGNLRSRSSALQAAEAALRYCEAMVTASTITAEQTKLKKHIQDQDIAVNNLDAKNPTAPMRMWETLSNWVITTEETSPAFEVPESFKFDSSGANLIPPQCMIEKLDLPDADNPAGTQSNSTAEAFLITARGFSPNYSEKNQILQTGSVVWVQSTVQISAR